MRLTSILRIFFIVAIPFIVTAILMAQQTENRGTAEIGVIADFTTPGKTNIISLRIIGSSDQVKLQNIANLLGYKLGVQPVLMGFSNGDPAIITDTGVGLDFQLPIMTNDGFLPIGPFAEACAPYVSNLKIAYIITGNYTYKGFENYQDADISYTVPSPSTTKQNANPPIAFYSANVIIKKKTISAITIPRNQAEKQKKQNKNTILTVFIIILAGGLITGAILAWVVSKHKKNKL